MTIGILSGAKRPWGARQLSILEREDDLQSLWLTITWLFGCSHDSWEANDKVSPPKKYAHFPFYFLFLQTPLPTGSLSTSEVFPLNPSEPIHFLRLPLFCFTFTAFFVVFMAACLLSVFESICPNVQILILLSRFVICINWFDVLVYQEVTLKC